MPCPTHGLAEDPVCGSANAAVAYYKQRRSQTSDYIATQGLALGRRGKISMKFTEQGKIQVGGSAMLVYELARKTP